MGNFIIKTVEVLLSYILNVYNIKKIGNAKGFLYIVQ